MTTAAIDGPWYRALSRSQWNALIASNLGWLFDGFETYALILTAGVALRQLLDPSQYAQIPSYIGTVIAIIAYSIATGLSAFAFDWMSFVALRFLVGIAIGSEWATGSSMLAELWPDRARGKGAGIMQCGLGLGFFLASFTWLFLSQSGPNAWRYMFALGVLPALLTLWIRRAIPESKIWEETNQKRRLAIDQKRSGVSLGEGAEKLTRFTLFDLFTDASLRRRTIVVFLMSLTTTVGFWGISTWVPPFIGSLAVKESLNAAQWASYAGMAYTIGSVLGYLSMGFLMDAFGRKPVTIAFFIMALLMTPVLFFMTTDLRLLLLLATVNAFFSNGQYTWMPVWLPELYPTRMRATALAFAFNGPRFIAFLGPLLAGTMITQFGGFGHAAMALASIYVVGIIAAFFLPETKGSPLPA
jgi:MFS family permease